MCPYVSPFKPFATNTLCFCPFLSALYLYYPLHPSPKPHSPSPPLSRAPFSWPSYRRSHSCFPGTGTQRSLSHSTGLCAVIQPFSGNAIPPCDTAIACIYCHLALMINNGRDDLMIVHPDIIFWSLSDSFNLPHPELDHSAASGTGVLTEQCALTWTTWIRIKWAAGLCFVPQRVSEGLRFLFWFFFLCVCFFLRFKITVDSRLTGCQVQHGPRLTVSMWEGDRSCSPHSAKIQPTMLNNTGVISRLWAWRSLHHKKSTARSTTVGTVWRVEKLPHMLSYWCSTA